MGTRVLTTYAILTYLNSVSKNQIDLYVPIACRCLINHLSEHVTKNNLAKWIQEEYGLKIYIGVCDTLLKRMSHEPYKYVQWSNGEYVVVTEKIINKLEQHKEGAIEEEITILCNKILGFAENVYSTKYTNAEIQSGLSTFFDNHDGDMIFEEEKLINSLKRSSTSKTSSKKIKYIISQFIIWSKENDLDSFVKLKNISKGHAIASIIAMQDVGKYVGKMENVVIALDAPIMFNLLGLNEDSNKQFAEELLTILKKQGCRFIIFNQHFQELKQTFTSTIHLLFTKNYSLEKASRLLKYAVRNNISGSQLSLILQNLENTLSKWDITVEQAPDTPIHYNDIDESMLSSLITSSYNGSSTSNEDEFQKLIIENDVEAISYIYKIRGNDVASNLKNCKALLLTTNNTLAYHSNNKNVSRITHQIPVCMTDVFLSTILWFNYPEKSENINEQVLMNECYKNINLSDDILIKFYNDVRQINDKNPLSEEQIILVNTSQIVQDMLEKKTFNDISQFTDTTTSEILQEIEISRNQELNRKNDQLKKYDIKFEKIASYLSKFIIVICWFLLLVIFIALKLVDFSNWTGIYKILFNIISILPAIWGLLVWFGIIRPKIEISNKLKIKLKTYIEIWFNKES